MIQVTTVFGSLPYWLFTTEHQLFYVVSSVKKKLTAFSPTTHPIMYFTYNLS